MTAQSWARHANPLSVYSRIFGGTLVFLAFWSLHWIGWYAALVIAAAFVWVWVNPRLFPPPTHANAWATKGVLGERVFLNRRAVPVPAGFVRAAQVTTGLALACLVLTVLAFWQRDVWLAFTAWHAGILAKLWFCDRMVWLWDVMKDATPEYKRWAAADWQTT